MGIKLDSHIKERHRLKVFKNRVLKTIFGTKREKGAFSWRKLQNDELHNLYFSEDIIRTIKSRMMRWTGHVACMGKMRNAYKSMVGNPEGKRGTWKT
jgi:hypothetical protein